jgi:hypothetical protein
MHRRKNSNAPSDIFGNRTIGYEVPSRPAPPPAVAAALPMTNSRATALTAAASNTTKMGRNPGVSKDNLIAFEEDEDDESFSMNNSSENMGVTASLLHNQPAKISSYQTRVESSEMPSFSGTASAQRSCAAGMYSQGTPLYSQGISIYSQGASVYSSIPPSLYFQVNSDEHLDLNALTLMEQVVLIGLKDKQVRPHIFFAPISKTFLGLFVSFERLYQLCSSRLFNNGISVSGAHPHCGILPVTASLRESA